ncbi:MAG: glycosyl hydrolase [Bacteroidota bacterium]
MLDFTLNKHLLKIIIVPLFLLTFTQPIYSQLKSIVYDFDGLDIGESDLPEGDYALGDLSYEVSPSPLSPEDMIGDRVLKLNLNWSSGMGGFGRGISRYIEFDPTNDRLNFFLYNPSSNNQDALLDVILTDDDDQDHVFNYSQDDEWHKVVTISVGSTWQLVSIPLNQFTDANTGGNSNFDIAFSQNKGMLLTAELKFQKQNPTVSNATFYVDMICFSDGTLLSGNSELDLPSKNNSDYCMLGAFQQELSGQEDLIPSHFESLFPNGSGKKIKYVNYFHDWSIDGSTTANNIPGMEVQNLLTNGYTPVITWEPMFKGYGRLDPVQPRLSNIINGDYDSYIDAVANKLKSFNDTIIIRLMHEFEGDWYSWSLFQNNHDPGQYITAYRKVVDRFRQLGATKVKWMWCVNSDYAPYESYNYVVNAYPGNNYIDIVATDIYNNHFPVNSPYWKSFRMQTAETYYYLSKHFPQKPLFICEVGCRERLNNESTNSESKGAWYQRMDKELQSNYHNVRALIFFNANPDQNWLINSSAFALQSLTNNVWNDPYYFPTNLIGIPEQPNLSAGLQVYPNPAKGMVTVRYPAESENSISLTVLNTLGQTIYQEKIKSIQQAYSTQINFNTFGEGIYIVTLTENTSHDSKTINRRESRKVIVY